MHNVVIGVEALPEDPEIVLIGQEVHNAELLRRILELRVNDHVLGRELEPEVLLILLETFVAVNDFNGLITIGVRVAALNHKLNITHCDGAVDVEDAVFLNIGDPGEQEFKEALLEARGHQIVGQGSGHDGDLGWDRKSFRCRD